MRLESKRQGRWLARRVLFKLAKAGPEACRANRSKAQAGALRASLDRLLLIGTPEARQGFAQVLTDFIGVRSYAPADELARFYERLEAERALP